MPNLVPIDDLPDEFKTSASRLVPIDDLPDEFKTSPQPKSFWQTDLSKPISKEDLSNIDYGSRKYLLDPFIDATKQASEAVTYPIRHPIEFVKGMANMSAEDIPSVAALGIGSGLGTALTRGNPAGGAAGAGLLYAGIENLKKHGANLGRTLAGGEPYLKEDLDRTFPEVIAQDVYGKTLEGAGYEAEFAGLPRAAKAGIGKVAEKVGDIGRNKSMKKIMETFNLPKAENAKMREKNIKTAETILDNNLKPTQEGLKEFEKLKSNKRKAVDGLINRIAKDGDVLDISTIEKRVMEKAMEEWGDLPPNDLAVRQKVVEAEIASLRNVPETRYRIDAYTGNAIGEIPAKKAYNIRQNLNSEFGNAYTRQDKGTEVAYTKDAKLMVSDAIREGLGEKYPLLDKMLKSEHQLLSAGAPLYKLEYDISHAASGMFETIKQHPLITTGIIGGVSFALGSLPAGLGLGGLYYLSEYMSKPVNKLGVGKLDRAQWYKSIGEANVFQKNVYILKIKMDK